jgi:hypothetical protein
VAAHPGDPARVSSAPSTPGARAGAHTRAVRAWQVPVRPEWGLPEAEDERVRQPGWHEYRWRTLTLSMLPLQAEHLQPSLPSRAQAGVHAGGARQAGL